MIIRPSVCVSVIIYNPLNFLTRARFVSARHVTEYSPAKTGEYSRTFPNFQNCARCGKDLKNNIDLGQPKSVAPVPGCSEPD